MALLIPLGLFCHFAVCGRAAFHLLGLRLGHARTWLLAPALGLAIVGLAIMVLNQAGLPVIAFARPLMIGTLFGAGYVLYRGRVSVPRSLWPFGAIALGALVLGGWPAFEYGLEWVAYGNDDMTNYCLGAQRFLTHGFYAIPTPAELGGSDYSWIFWLLNVATLERFASQLFIAGAAGATGLNTVRVFMPVILSLALVQLWAVMGLAYACPRRRARALVAGAILGTAPLWHYGTTYQLIAQVGGLALLAALLAVVARTRFPRNLVGRLKLALLCSLLIAGLGITYPEVMPFLVVGWSLYFFLRVRSRGRWIAGTLPTIGLTLLFVVVLLRHNVLSTVFTLLDQAKGGLDTATVTNRFSLFPYFLMPAGPAFFFGFDVIAWRYPDPIPSLALVGGFVAGAITLGLWIRGLREHAVSATVLAGMLLVGALLFASDNGFGFFKLAMFALPFVAIELAGLLEMRALRPTAWVLFGALLPVWIAGSWRYTGASLARATSMVNELFDASVSRGNLPSGPAPVWSDMASSPVGKLFMLEQPSAHPAFLSQIYGEQFFGIAARPHPDWAYRMLPGEVRATTAAGLVDYVCHQVYHGRQAGGLDFWSCAAAEGAPADPATVLATSRAELRSFNKLSPDRFPPSPGLFNQATLSGLENHLVFIQTKQGQHYYLGEPGQISVYKPERDPYSPGGYIFAIGRHLLFRVINPADAVRLRLNLTASLLGEGRSGLAQEAAVAGAAGPASLGLVGSGSANIFSPPLQPALVDGVPYLALDLGRPVMPVGQPASGLQGLYNRNLSFDTRFALGYCRDISLVSDREYLARPRQREVSRFPADLVGSHAVEYSGLYEDGWTSRQAFVVLGPVAAGDRIAITGMRPEIPGKKPTPQRVELRVAGVAVLAQDLPPGRFTLEAPLSQAAPQVKIELHFDHDEALPAPDHRPVTVLLESIKITSSL